MGSADLNRGGFQLAAGGLCGGEVRRRGHRTPNMGLQAQSLAILGPAMPTSALPLTTLTLLPSVMGWDCSDPLNLTVLDASGSCTPATAGATSGEKPVYIVQFNAVKRDAGFKCEVTINTVQFICGLFSYQKHLETSRGTKCEQMVSSRKFPLQILGFSTF